MATQYTYKCQACDHEFSAVGDSSAIRGGSLKSFQCNECHDVFDLLVHRIVQGKTLLDHWLSDEGEIDLGEWLSDSKIEIIEPKCPNDPSHVLVDWPKETCPKCQSKLSGNYLIGINSLD